MVFTEIEDGADCDELLREEVLVVVVIVVEELVILLKLFEL